MKLTGLLVLLPLFSFAILEEIELPSHYTIVSDTFSMEVPVGKCIVKGKVSYYDELISDGRISNLDGSRSTETDENGEYSLTLSPNDTALFFYHPKYEEVVVWKFEFKERHLVQIDFHSVPHSNGMLKVAEKPVIYMYSDEPLSARIELEPKGSLTYSYPDYANGWEMEISKDGMLTDSKTIKKYPYLFWEANIPLDNLNTFTESSMVYDIDTDTVINFLENKLSDFGLNTQESADFITYWGPRMSVHEHASVHFLIDDKYADHVAGLKIDPKPDAVRRVFMLFSQTEANSILLKSNVTANDLSNHSDFIRKGFVVIEWGGVELINVSGH